MYHFIINATTTCEQTYIYRRFDLFLIIFANDFSDADTGKEPHIDVTGVVDSGKKKKWSICQKVFEKILNDDKIGTKWQKKLTNGIKSIVPNLATLSF